MTFLLPLGWFEFVVGAAIVAVAAAAVILGVLILRDALRGRLW